MWEIVVGCTLSVRVRDEEGVPDDGVAERDQVLRWDMHFKFLVIDEAWSLEVKFEVP